MMSYPRTHIYDGNHAAYQAKMRAMDSEQEYNRRITAQAEQEMQEHETKERMKKENRAKIVADEEIYYLLS